MLLALIVLQTHENIEKLFEDEENLAFYVNNYTSKNNLSSMTDIGVNTTSIQVNQKIKRKYI